MVHLFINRVHLFNIDPNIDYILMLVEQYHEGNCEDKEILTSIRKAVDASMQLRSKKELIEAFINRVNVDTQVTTDWRRFVLTQEENDLAKIIMAEKLKPEETRKFVSNAFRDGVLKTTGTEINKLMPPVSRFGGSGRAKKKQGVIEKLKAFFEKYHCRYFAPAQNTAGGVEYLQRSASGRSCFAVGGQRVCRPVRTGVGPNRNAGAESAQNHPAGCRFGRLGEEKRKCC